MRRQMLDQLGHKHLGCRGSACDPQSADAIQESRSNPWVLSMRIAFRQPAAYAISTRRREFEEFDPANHVYSVAARRDSRHGPLPIGCRIADVALQASCAAVGRRYGWRQRQKRR